MTDTLTNVEPRQVKAHLHALTETVRSEPFLERHVRPLLSSGAPNGGGAERWSTETIQLDGTGAATVRISLDGAGTVFAKLFPFGDGKDVYAKLQYFRVHGFGDGARYQTVEPLAWVGRDNVMICAEAAGLPLSDLLSDERLSSACAEAGRWLGTFHASPLRIGRPQSLLVSGELVSLAKRLTKVMARNPGHLELAIDMLGDLERLTKDTADGVLAQSHGQYRPIHVFLGSSTVTVIDLDRSGPADPARDCAEFLHHLRNGVHSATGEVSRADAPCEAFLDGYRETGGDQRLTNLRFHWARYLFHSLNRQVKDAQGASGATHDAVRERIRAEFDRVVEGRAGA